MLSSKVYDEIISTCDREGNSIAYIAMHSDGILYCWISTVFLLWLYVIFR